MLVVNFVQFFSPTGVSKGNTQDQHLFGAEQLEGSLWKRKRNIRKQQQWNSLDLTFACAVSQCTNTSKNAKAWPASQRKNAQACTVTMHKQSKNTKREEKLTWVPVHKFLLKPHMAYWGWGCCSCVWSMCLYTIFSNNVYGTLQCFLNGNVYWVFYAIGKLEIDSKFMYANRPKKKIKKNIVSLCTQVSQSHHFCHHADQVL